MTFVPKGHPSQQDQGSKPKNQKTIPPPPTKAPRKITQSSIETLFAQLSELQAYLASADSEALLSPEQLDEYRVNAPQYHGEDGGTKTGRSAMGSTIFEH